MTTQLSPRIRMSPERFRRCLLLAWRRLESLTRHLYVTWRYEGLRSVGRALLERRRGATLPAAKGGELPDSIPPEAAAVVPTVAGVGSPQRPQPVVSLIIPVYNGLSYVRQCIESIYAAPVSVPFETVVIDQASEDGSRAYLREQAALRGNLRLIENPVNVGFPQAINQGAAHSCGEFLAVLNSDVIVTPGWLDRLLQAMWDDPQLAVASPVTNYVGEGPQVDAAARGLAAEQANAYAEQVAHRAGVQPVIDRLVFFCVLIRRRAFDLLQGMAGGYGLGNFEDDDFCLRARMAGWKLAIVPSAFVFHHGSRTFRNRRIPHRQWMAVNEKVFYQRVADLSVRLPAAPRHRPSARPAVTVVMRTRNRPALLEQALNSLANQTYRDFEVVLVNDGGEDVVPLLERVSPYLRISYVSHCNARGRSAALNAGLSRAAGRWLTYLDDDDLVYPTHLENLAAVLADTDRRVAYANANRALCWSDLKRDVVVERLPFPSREFAAHALLVENWIPIMSFMHSADCLDALGGFDEKLDLFEDWDFLIRLAGRYAFGHLRRPTCEYRYRFGDIPEDSASTLKLRERVYRATTEIYERYPAPNREIKERRAFTLAALRQDIEEVRWIEGLAVSDLEKKLLIAAYLGRFPEPRRYIERCAQLLSC